MATGEAEEQVKWHLPDSLGRCILQRQREKEGVEVGNDLQADRNSLSMRNATTIIAIRRVHLASSSFFLTGLPFKVNMKKRGWQ